MDTKSVWIEGGITAVQGVKAGGLRCGVKEKGEDLALVHCQGDVVAAAVFTTNSVKAAPVIISEDIMRKGAPKGVVVNSGVANACTLESGLEDAREMSQLAESCLGDDSGPILVASTGKISMNLPMEKIRGGIEKLAPIISDQGGASAARAIMTTDKVPKTSALQYTAGGYTVRIGGMTKGAGMIFPRMATMLAFIATDAAVRRDDLQSALKNAVDHSFNRITVDGDTSTNDTVFLFANGMAGHTPLTASDPAFSAFQDSLQKVCLDLAKKIVRDGEGATKFVEVRIKEAADEDEALEVARAIANSLLVKTALYGQDPNWGRILAAAGSTAKRMETSGMMLYIGHIRIVENGVGAAEDRLEAAKKVLAEKDVQITLHLGAGSAECSVWTTDLTEEYVRFNSHYHT